VTVLLADADTVEVDQCTTVTSSYKLTASGVTPNTPATGTGSNGTANLPQPVLLTTSELPPSGQLCFSSQITYNMQVAPVSSSSSSTVLLEEVPDHSPTAGWHPASRGRCVA
jgi:hypothetical protein